MCKVTKMPYHVAKEVSVWTWRAVTPNVTASHILIFKHQNFPTRATNKSKPMHIPVQIGHGLIFMILYECQLKLPNLKYANMRKLLHGTVGKMLQHRKCSFRHIQRSDGVAVTWHWLMWLERCWGGCDGCTACRLQCSISQSVSAANISKLRERCGRPRNLHGFLVTHLRCPRHEGPSGSAINENTCASHLHREPYN